MLDFRMFKIPVAPPVGPLWVSGFPVVIIRDPVFFNVMASPALFGFSKIRSFICYPNRLHMIDGIKTFMNMTTFAIFINNVIVLWRVKFSIKGIFNTPLRTPAHKGNQEHQKCQKRDFIKSLYAHEVGSVSRPSDRRRGKLVVIFKQHFNPGNDFRKGNERPRRKWTRYETHLWE